jgi:hypothetical protein
VLAGSVDTTSAAGRLVFGIFAALAEFEHDLIHGRTMAGLAAARGRTGGRPRLMTRAKLRTAMAMMAVAATPRPMSPSSSASRSAGSTPTWRARDKPSLGRASCSAADHAR